VIIKCRKLCGVIQIDRTIITKYKFAFTKYFILLIVDIMITIQYND